MSERMGGRAVARPVVIAAVLASALLGEAAGQDLDVLRHRADSIATLWRDAQLLVTIQDSLRRTTLPAAMERVTAGSLVVLADPSRLPLHEATADAWDLLDRFYGDAAQSLAHRPVVLRVVSE